MSDATVWCAAALLVSAGAAADGYLAWVFIRDWRRGRSDEKARPRARRRRAAGATREGGSRLLKGAMAGLASMSVGAGVAGAQDPAAQSVSGTPTIQTGEPGVLPAVSDPRPAAPVPEAHAGSAIGVQINLDFTNAYFYRGIRQQDQGLIVQPAARLTARLADNESFKLDGFAGVWGSFGANGGSRNDDLVQEWYECDLLAGLTVTHDKLSLTASYTFLTSPSDAFETVQELDVSMALDDSDWLKAWSLKPYATLAIETGANASDGADSNTGVYLELGVAPGFSFDAGTTRITVSFPAVVGLSLSDYYQDGAGRDDSFGFAQIGAKASIPLGIRADSAHGR